MSCLPLGKAAVRTSKPPLSDSLESVKLLPVESGESLSDSCPPLGAAAPLGVLL